MLPYQTISQQENGIAIVGIGGAGANVLQCFAASSAEHVRLYTMSLDERVGRDSGNVEFIQLGEGVSHGLGSGGDPEVGRLAMEESAARVSELFADCKLLVMVVGLGGGTGSGAAPVLARMAREAGLFLVSVMMMPFSFEGKRRREQADLAQEEIARLSDIVFCFENDYMEELFRNRSGARAVFEEVDRLLAKATASVPMIATSPGLINLGLDELATALENHDSRCIFGSGSGYGAKRAEQAARAAVESPLATYHGALRFARSVIVHIAGGDSMSLAEIRQAMEIIHDALGSDEVSIFFGATVRPHLGDEIRITLIASIDAEEFKTSFLHTEMPMRPADPAPEAAPEEADEAPAAPPEPSEEPEAEAVIPEESAEEPQPEEDELPEEPEPETPEQPDPTDDEPTEPAEPEVIEEQEAQPTPRPAPRRSSAPAPAPAPEPEPAPEPAPTPRPQRTPAPRRKPQQLDLFAPPSGRSDALNSPPFSKPADFDEESVPTPARGLSFPHTDAPPAGRRRRAAQQDTADDWDIPPSLRTNDLSNIFPDN